MSLDTVVIKYGGHAMSDADLAMAFADDLAKLVLQGMRFVIVHGGGPQITNLLTRLNIESHFVNGLRVTDAATMQVVEMTLCGEVNKAVVSSFARRQVRAVGISGRDGGLLNAVVKNPELGFVGEICSVNSALLECLLNGGFVPVVAPVAAGPHGDALNINADTAAGAIAGALHAAFFVLVSDVPGVLNAEQKLVPELDRRTISHLKDENIIHGGMIPKVDACLNALSNGCQRSLILDGRATSSLSRYLLHGEALGTTIVEYSSRQLF